jgi:hypothetical protein
MRSGGRPSRALLAGGSWFNGAVCESRSQNGNNSQSNANVNNVGRRQDQPRRLRKGARGTLVRRGTGDSRASASAGSLTVDIFWSQAGCLTPGQRRTRLGTGHYGFSIRSSRNHARREGPDHYDRPALSSPFPTVRCMRLASPATANARYASERAHSPDASSGATGNASPCNGAAFVYDAGYCPSRCASTVRRARRDVISHANTQRAEFAT